MFLSAVVSHVAANFDKPACARDGSSEQECAPHFVSIPGLILTLQILSLWGQTCKASLEIIRCEESHIKI